MNNLEGPLTPGVEKSRINGQEAQAHALEFFEQIFEPNQVSISDTSINFYKKEYIDKDKVEVGVFTVNIKLDIENSDQLMQDLLQRTSSPEIVEYLHNKIIAAKRLKEFLSRKNIQLEGETLTIQELTKICFPEINTRTLQYIFDKTVNGVINVGDIRNILDNNLLNADLELTYKRIHNGRQAIKNEIENYRIFAEKGFNTFCALNTIPLDQSEAGSNDNAAFIYTLNVKNLIVIAEEGNLFSQANLVLSQMLSEVARMYNAGLTHGDLHFRNVGYKKEKRKNVIIFDLVRSTHDGENHSDRVMRDLLIFRNSILAMVSETRRLDKEYAKTTLDKFLSDIKPIFEGEEGKYNYILDLFIDVFAEIDSKH